MSESQKVLFFTGVCVAALCVTGGCETVKGAMDSANRGVKAIEMKSDKDGLPTKHEVERVTSANFDLSLVPRLELASRQNDLPDKADFPFTLSGRAKADRLVPPPTTSIPVGNYFRVHIQDISQITSEQTNPEWCWAACVEMALREQGYRSQGEKTMQASIAEQFRGESSDQTGNFALILRALRPDKASALKGRMFTPVLAGSSADMIVHRLSRGELVIAGLKSDPNAGGGGHAVVVTSCTFSIRKRSAWRQFTDATRTERRTEDEIDMDVKCALYSVDYFDPWPGEGLKSMSAEFLNDRVQFLASWGYAGNQIDEFLRR